ncbi:MAG: DUF655 domain-containing protein [Desulfurococcales archaeon]|nr:DUF655 domain-containing protein [Desulfurococcales archaeon]
MDRRDVIGMTAYRGRGRQSRKPSGPPHPAVLEGWGVVLDVLPVEGPVRGLHQAYALGGRWFNLVRGVAVTDGVDLLDDVAIVREVVKHVVIPQGQGVRPARFYLACVSRKGEVICTPMQRLSSEEWRQLEESLGLEDSRVIVRLLDLDGFKEALEGMGLPGEAIASTARDYVSYSDLSDLARENLLEAAKKILRSRPEIVIEFFNKAEPINIRQHSLELLRGIGKKTIKAIMEKRPFKSLDDIKKVIKADPVEIVAERIVEELSTDQKYYLFVKPRDPSKPFLNYLRVIYGA